MTCTTYITTHKRVSPCPRVHNKLLLLGLFLQNRPVAGAHAKLLMRLTYNKGLTNPKYKGTQQDLTDERKRLQGYASLRGVKVSLKQESRLTFA